MALQFDRFTLDLRLRELREGEAVVPVEPQVFDLLALLVEQNDRVVSKDELIDEIWKGRVVSDAAISSRIRSARQAIGDTGGEQRLIRTVHGVGFRFVVPVTETHAAISISEPEEPVDEQVKPPTRPSIAVLPFQSLDAGPPTIIADAIPHDLIQAFSKLRWLFVIARLSSFRFRGPEVDVADAGRQLGARYCLTGVVESAFGKVSLGMELMDTQTSELIWADGFSFPAEEVHGIRSQVVGQVVSALEIQIPAHEANIARLNATENLDAWSSYHLGLQRVYRFNKRENQAAKTLFENAVAQDPDFARAHAGLSFAYFQDSFLKYETAAEKAAALALRHAERAVELDPMDPFANLTMGRYFWLKGDLDISAGWLERVNQLSPNHAQAIYSKAWVDALIGRAEMSLDSVNLAIRLSPFDPMLYAMYGVRALNHIASGDPKSAAFWADKAALSPGAHFLIALIAVVAHAMNDDPARAREWSDRVRKMTPGADAAIFLGAFPFQNEAVRKLVEKSLASQGFPG